MRRALLALLLVSLPALAEDDIGESEGTELDTVAGGLHWRLVTQRGPVHVWQPGAYRAASAGLVVYIHGLFVRVDEAWQEHGLAEQFADSGANALFVVPEAPAAFGEGPVWDSLDDLLDEVWRRTRIAPPAGPRTVAGHSGAYRTIISWLPTGRIDNVVLLDALYGNENEFGAWIDDLRAAARRMIVVARDTRRWAGPFAKRRGFSEILRRIPESSAELAPEQRRARLLYLRSQFGHMEIVTWKRTLPLLLRLALGS